VNFVDASAAAKRYFQEIGSNRVEELWKGSEPLFSLVVLHCELSSILNQKRREGDLPPGAHASLKKLMREDVSKIRSVHISPELIEEALRLLDSHPLKTLDALYLAGAAVLQRDLAEPVLFVSADRQLLRAARGEGMRTLDSEASS